MLNLLATILFHILVTTAVLGYSETEVYEPLKTRGDQLFMSSRSHLDRERSTRRVFSENPIRFGGRSDIPPLVGKAMEYESILENEMNRDRRAFSKNNHLRFGRANSNFMRFGRKNEYNSRFGRSNNNFLRFGRRSSDFIRFGRSDNGHPIHKRDTSDWEKRANSNFMRFGKRFDEDDYLDNILEDYANIDTVDAKLHDTLLMKFISHIICKFDNSKCDERLA